VDHAVAGEPVVVGIARLELRVGAVAVEGAAQTGGNLALDDQLEVVFRAQRGEGPERSGAKAPAR